MSLREEYDAYCAEHGTPDRLELLLCDLNAVLRGKWLPGDEIDKIEAGSVRLPLSTYAPAITGSEVKETGLGISVGDPDGVLTPLPGTLKPVPWVRGNVAQVLVEMYEPDGAVCTASPRLILSRVLDRFAARGLKPVVATELEFYIVKTRAHADEAPEAPLRTPDAQNYDLEVLSRQEAILTGILDACRDQGLATDTLIAEYGPGQFEVNFQHTDDPVEAAETALFFRRLVRGVVARHGMEATFMAKPYADHPGSGMHVHASVLDTEGRNIFTPEGDEIAPELGHAVAGVLETMRDLHAIFSPHMNSYRRFQAGSFAPSTPDWGVDNRSVAIRLPEITGPAARLEHRIGGADVNPYLALTAVLGGMLRGLENRTPLPPAVDDDAHVPVDPLTHDWATAVERFAASDIAAEVFGAEYRDIYAAVRRDEIAALTSIINPVEYRYYLSRF